MVETTKEKKNCNSYFVSRQKMGFLWGWLILTKIKQHPGVFIDMGWFWGAIKNAVIFEAMSYAPNFLTFFSPGSALPVVG